MENTNYEHVFYLYGLEGADKNYRAARCTPVKKNQQFLLGEIDYQVEQMKKDPLVETIWLMDNRWGLRRDFFTSFRSKSIEECAVFKDLLEREGRIMWTR